MEKRIRCPKCKLFRNSNLVAFCPVCISPDEYKKRRKLIEERRKKKRHELYIKHREENIRRSREYRIANKIIISNRNKNNVRRKQLNKIRCRERYYKIKQNPVLFEQLMKKMWAKEKEKKYEKV